MIDDLEASAARLEAWIEEVEALELLVHDARVWHHPSDSACTASVHRDEHGRRVRCCPGPNVTDRRIARKIIESAAWRHRHSPSVSDAG